MRCTSRWSSAEFRSGYAGSTAVARGHRPRVRTVASELGIRILEARSILSPGTVGDVRLASSDIEIPPAGSQATNATPAPRRRRTLLARLINDLQWRYIVNEATRRYSKLVTRRTATLSLVALVFFVGAIIVIATWPLTFRYGDFLKGAFNGAPARPRKVRRQPVWRSCVELGRCLVTQEGSWSSRSVTWFFGSCFSSLCCTGGRAGGRSWKSSCYGMKEAQRVEQRDDGGRHDSRLSANARNLNRRKAYGVFGSRIAITYGCFVFGGVRGC